MSQKPKLKTESPNVPSWVYPLVSPMRVDFESPLSLENCVLRIQEQQRLRPTAYRKVKVEVQRIDTDTYRICVRRWGRKYAAIEANGILKRWGDRTTYVSAWVNVDSSRYILFVVFIVFFLLMLFGWGQVQIMLPYLGFFALWFFLMRRSRHDVIRIIERALRKPKTTYQ